MKLGILLGLSAFLKIENLNRDVLIIRIKQGDDPITLLILHMTRKKLICQEKYYWEIDN